MKSSLKFMILFFVLMFSFNRSFAAESFTEEAIIELDGQIESLNNLSPYLTRTDSAQVEFLISANKKLINIINEKGVGHIETFKEYYTYYIKYRYSSGLFAKLSGKIVKQDIEAILNTFNNIVERKGLNDDPFLNIVESNFFQFKKLVDQLKKENISEELREFLFPTSSNADNIVSDLGHLLAKAKAVGDRPETFMVATEFYEKWVNEKELYEQFDNHLSQDGTFQIHIQMMGILEFMSDYLQIKDSEEEDL